LKKGNLLAVVGPQGIGKTTFLHSIMRENSITKGKATISGSIAFV